MSEQIIDSKVISSHNLYLTEKVEKLLQNQISWDSISSANIITPEQASIITKGDSTPEYIDALMAVAENVTTDETLQKTLALVDEATYKNVSLLENFNEKYLNILIKLLSKDNETIQLLAGRIIASKLSNVYHVTDIDYTPVFQWVTNLLDSSNMDVVDLASQYIQSYLTAIPLRKEFYNNCDGVSKIVNVLVKKNPNSQLQYQLIFSIWLLTFEESICQVINKTHNIIPVLIDIAKSAIKEKIVRVVLQTFRNMLEKAPGANMIPMLGNKMLPFCETLLGRKWSDTEITDDLTYLKEELGKNIQKLSTFDEYSTEVFSGKLEWSPPHKSEQFWKNNAEKLNENNYELLKVLTRLFSTSTDPVILAVACNDLGQYVKYHPEGKKVVQDIGAKQHIMELMTHEDPDVRYQALCATQKIK
ncbi:ATPase, V1 complex, subunit H [Neocallimastix californiae]|uniref:ATPase, V1 complex, subunit H n=1 Tax=Neocallimastix californiae TaxID=1754190 RepID=A0A1Y2ALQ6_9FUNG|nr:ATPase, V1 complex, subunit H [Neocallimastix californiae]|eukprot:ORY23491.1 ATPase, V1 complex, subunit H [Neocallimastix californiae]